jgi:hypothetical protein
MKRIILSLIVAFSFFAADAQTTKAKSKKAKKTATTAESRAKAKHKAAIAKIQRDTDERIAELRKTSFYSDSMRIDSERVARDSFELSRKNYLETRFKEIDSTNKAGWAKMSADKEQYSKTEQSFEAINKAAKLGSYQGRQVKYINQTYSDKANVIKQDMTLSDEQKKQQLAALNTERRTKIKTVIGRSKEKKLEKERKDYVKKFGDSVETSWINEADTYAAN